MLNFPSSWRFEAPGEPIPQGVISSFSEFISRIAFQGSRQEILEHFKSHFAGAAGIPYAYSSNTSWAESDLSDAMRSAAVNAPLFIVAFWTASQSLQAENPNLGVPNLALINRVLGENATGYEIRPPDLVFSGTMTPVAVPVRQPSLDEQAQEIIQNALRESERLLLEGRHRQAVSEILWLLETVSTAFRGMETGTGKTVQEKYFITIARELKRHHKGQMLEQVIDWISKLYGFLSSPTGGGVRHGADIKHVVELPKSDAQLYCNLIRSYVTYLMAEHERMSRTANPFL
ncbi:hypothetical protein [Pseudoroseomonas cervicalis]|uniref:hypothetical protein n=1 Tax=Teichococcus cervicalis TaxID=204525 RepID=UPI002784075D|nr:hypothetical protein [Pseudoroseomonas cervicalis]MDQ1079677.1 hypothetical protein [Pseudoroseomonas cervicalis]